jgi:hypothetical protein
VFSRQDPHLRIAPDHRIKGAADRSEIPMPIELNGTGQTEATGESMDAYNSKAPDILLRNRCPAEEEHQRLMRVAVHE